MARSKSRRKKEKKVSLDVAVVSMIIMSILLAVLIYMKSGFIGEHLSPALGGIMGYIKYIVPIGIFAIAIYIACNKEKDVLNKKLMQYTIFLICISIILSVFQISAGHINISKNIKEIVEQAYYLGERNIGGGVIGTLLAAPLINMLGSLGTIILALGVAIVLIIFIFAIKPAELIANTVDNLEEKRQIRKKIGSIPARTWAG